MSLSLHVHLFLYLLHYFPAYSASDHKPINKEDWKTRKHVSYHGDLSDLENGRQEEAEDYGNGSMRDNLSGGLMHEEDNSMHPNDSLAMRRASRVMMYVWILISIPKSPLYLFID